MKIDIDKLCEIARLKLDEKEKREIEKDLNNILNAFEVLSSIDVGDIEPTFRPVDVVNAYRDDIVKESINRVVLMKNVKNKEEGYYKGPRCFK